MAQLFPGGYATMTRQIIDKGDIVESRIGPSYEVTSVTALFVPGTMATRKGLNDSIGWTEMLQLIGGVFTPEKFLQLAPNAAQELFTAQMAYGPRVADQIPDVLHELQQNPTSRRAVLMVAHPEDGPGPNIPCTLSMQFLIRDGYLDMHVVMRSWDAVRGLPYDIVMFSGFQMAIAHALKRVVGNLRVTAGSLHVYKSDEDKLSEVDTVVRGFTFDLSGVEPTWGSIAAWARAENDALEPKATPTGITVIREDLV